MTVHFGNQVAWLEFTDVLGPDIPLLAGRYSPSVASVCVASWATDAR